jgi:hypothetical protein
MKKTCLFLALMFFPLKAEAALINDYSQTDDIWNSPIAPGRILIDARTSNTNTNPDSLSPPIALAPHLEVWGAYGFTGIGSSHSDKALPSYGQRLGSLLTLKKDLTTDLSLAFNESPGLPSTLTPNCPLLRSQQCLT